MQDNSLPIRLTNRAAIHINSWLQSQQDTTLIGIRLGIKTAGCSGHQYTVTPAAEKNKDDICFSSNGITILIDSQSLHYLQGTELDFVQEGLNSGFHFNNPNVDQTCGCGESFTLKEEHV